MYSKCISLVIIVTLSTNLVFGVKGRKIHVNVNDYYICVPLAFAPPKTTDVPSQRIQISGETLTATRHYIIPFHTLSTFMNLVLSEHAFESRLGAYLAINVREIYRYFKENATSHVSPPIPWLEWPHPSVLFLYDNLPTSFGNRSASLDVDHRMLAAFTWIPGNMFYGPPPNRRAHVPGDNLEVDAERIVGSEAFEGLRRLYYNMQNYINEPSQRTATNYDTIISDLIAVASARSRPYEFKQEDWVQAGANREGKLFNIKASTPGSEATTTSELKNIFTSGGVTDDDYLQATKLVCEEYLKHMKPKFNTNLTQVAIDDDVGPLVVYSIDKRHFVFGQSEKTRNWFIRRMDQYGRLGKVTQQGTWQNYYAVQIHFKIGGNNYLFTHKKDGYYNWFIHQLKPGGKIGQHTAYGYFDHRYEVLCYLSVNGEHYLYGQTDFNKKWFLRKLYSDGSMGSEISHGVWYLFYNIQFPITVGNKQYIVGHDTDSKYHTIRDINANNIRSMGTSNTWSELDRSYLVFFPFSFAGKTYFFGHDPNSKHFFVREVFGNVVEQKDIDIAFTDARPFNINGYQYFFAKLKDSSHWYQFHFDFNYFDD